MANLNEFLQINKSTYLATGVAPAGLVAGNMVEFTTENSDGTRNVQEPDAISSLDIAIIAPVTLPYSDLTLENDYIVPTGGEVRAVIPEKGQKLGFPKENFTATAEIVEGNFIIINAGSYKMECVSALGGTESVVYKIGRPYTEVGVSMIPIRCIKA